jgi:hypothetical protein
MGDESAGNPWDAIEGLLLDMLILVVGVGGRVAVRVGGLAYGLSLLEGADLK